MMAIAYWSDLKRGDPQFAQKVFPAENQISKKRKRRNRRSECKEIP
jgi:hypothetical protein